VFEWHARVRADRKSETGGEQSQEHPHTFLWHQWDCLHRIRPNRPNSQFHILLWPFMATASKYVKTSPRIWRQISWLLHTWQRSASHFLFHKGIFDQKQHDYHSPTHLTSLCFSDSK
jgi:hypothetical protein